MWFEQQPAGHWREAEAHLRAASPHLARAITVVILIQTIYLLGVYAEIQITTGGGPGFASTNLPFLIYNVGVLGGNIGAGAAGGLIAVVLANIVAIFLMRAVGRNLDA